MENKRISMKGKWLALQYVNELWPPGGTSKVATGGNSLELRKVLLRRRIARLAFYISC
jgi:hypothetical protein